MTKNAVIAAAFLGTTLTGCGGEPELTLAPVNGIITLNGQPLADAEVVFAPSDKDGRLAQDTTGPQGNYKVKTNDRFGLVPGLYKVSVVKSPAATSEVLARHQGDPFMAKLSMMPAGPARNAAKTAAKEGGLIKEEFLDKNVLAKGATLDFDIKVKTAAAAPASKKK